MNRKELKRIPVLLILLLITVLIISGCSTAEQDPLPAQPTTPALDQNEVGPSSSDGIIQYSTREADGMVQVHIPGGIYLRGSTGEGVEAGIELCQEQYHPCNRWYYEREFPQHEVTLSPFLIDQTEVSNQQYQKCVDAGHCIDPDQCKKGEPTYQDPQKADHPVVCVNWQEAVNYCEWVGSRLPTEAEWEYASRGAGSNIFPWGDELDGSNVNYCDSNCEQSHADPDFDDGYIKTAPAGSYPAGVSWAGLENIGGNVSEWVNDWYGDYDENPLEDPFGPASGAERIIKGCSWYSPAVYCRGATRGSADPNIRMDYLGFRCASSAPPVIDGSLDQGEWDQANKYEFEDGSELYLLYFDNHLYLAIKAISDEMITANVFMADGEKINILHTSAALGTAVYQPDGDTWRKTRDFEWCCRSKMDNASARSLRDAFYHTENWLGINTYNGNENELEYKISLSGSEEYLAVNFLRVDHLDDKYLWPVGISDGPAQPTIGGFPDTMDFSPEDWFALEVE